METSSTCYKKCKKFVFYEFHMTQYISGFQTATNYDAV